MRGLEKNRAYHKAAEGGHDLAESVDFGAEILIGAVGDEHHAVRGMKEAYRGRKLAAGKDM